MCLNLKLKPEELMKTRKLSQKVKYSCQLIFVGEMSRNTEFIAEVESG
jgi:hypothetical protein